MTRKWLLPKASRWFWGSPQSLLHLSIFTAEKRLLHQNSCTQQETGLELQGISNQSSKAILIWWVLHLFYHHENSQNRSRSNPGHTGFYGLKIRQKNHKAKSPWEGKVQHNAVPLPRTSRRHQRIDFQHHKCVGLFFCNKKVIFLYHNRLALNQN